jgi:DNA invertase Pin-like site-specific DNA recombinase
VTATKKSAGRRAVIYVRLSVSQDASVSIDRQIEAAEAYAAAHGWTVVETFKDDGVSASKNRPEDRKGWQELMACAKPWDIVIVWKLDRLVRRIVHFWDTYKWLDANGKSLVSVMDNLDMTTTMGRMVAGLLAGFAEMEAEAISTRVSAARKYLLENGRVVGGAIPYGYKSVPNPDGKGFVLTKNPETIEWVEEMVRRTQAGRSIYSTVQRLDEAGAPLPNGSQKNRKRDGWNYSTVERLLRNPILCGQIVHTPGNDTKQRGSRVVLGDDGLPVVYPDLAVLPVGQWRAMVASLDKRETPQSMPRALRAKTSGVLSGLMLCGEHDEPVRMWRGTVQGRPGYYCPECHQAISNFEHVVIAEFLRQKGERVRWTVVEEVPDGGAALLPEIELRIQELQDQQRATEDDDEYDRLADQIKGLRARRREVRDLPTTTELVYEPANLFALDWDAAETDEEKRDVLGDALHRITVRRGRPGRRTDAQVLARLTFNWKQPEDLGPIDETA